MKKSVIYEMYHLAYMARWDHYTIRPTSVLFFLFFVDYVFIWKSMKISKLIFSLFSLLQIV